MTSLAARVLHRARALLRAAEERLRDVLEGVDTHGRVEAGDIVADSPNRARGIRYQPSPARALRRVLASLPLAPGGAFVDIGAGKGRALLVASRLPFARLVGVEYSAPLCEIARRNLARVRTPVQIECIDAADFDFPDDTRVVYLFNPFDEVVLERLLRNLQASLQRAPRELWLVYHFPRWHERIAASGFLQPVEVQRGSDGEFAIFAAQPMKPRSSVA